MKGRANFTTLPKVKLRSFPVKCGCLLQDPRFSSDVDLKTGYKTNSILCMPICNYEGEVIGVAQIINKTNDSQEFTPHDVEVFRRYLTFCGIGIQNAQLFEVSVLEYKRNQVRQSTRTAQSRARARK
jgi:GAF domain-containing protein